MEYRIGIGYDIHRLVKGRKLFLGGIKIKHSHGLLGHSDADVLLHAISDALLGAVCAGDIGKHFPDTDSKYKGISSSILLEKSHYLVRQKGYKVNNIDAVIIAQAPRLEAFKEKIAENIADILKINSDQVNIKAKTNEGLGPVGRSEAIAVYAVVSLNSEKKK